jgi:hypothetical protein
MEILYTVLPSLASRKGPWVQIFILDNSSVNFLTLLYKKLSKITPILTGDAGNQCFFHVKPRLFRLSGLFSHY